MNLMKQEVAKQLHEHIFPFWIRLLDHENGGFYGLVDFDLNVHKEAPKGGIVAARFLWSFSAAYRITGVREYQRCAGHAYEFLVKKLYDAEHEGIYWMLDYLGNPLDDRKHVYAQSFGIYALSEYYRATGHEEALELAKRLFHLIEIKGFNQERNAYQEEFTRVWQQKSNEMLSGNGIMAHITTNTHLHVLEAYTNLYRVWPSYELEQRLRNLLRIFHENIYDPKTKFLKVFFDNQWNKIIQLNSYGHDIEASWLIDDALKVLSLESREYSEMVTDIACNIAENAIQSDGSMANEKADGDTDYTRVWWVQAEAMVGFLNAYQRTKDERFLMIVDRLWTYTKNHIIDPRDKGEWFWSVEPDGQPAERPVADPWKASYHNSRFCLEVIERVNTL